MVRPAQPSDLEALMQTARSSFHDSRFYSDPNFPRSRCDDFYASWIEKSCNGYADFVLVAENAGEPADFITGHDGAEGGSADKSGSTRFDSGSLRFRGRPH